MPHLRHRFFVNFRGAMDGRGGCAGLWLLGTGLHEDEAQFGGGLEDELAVVLGAGGIVEGGELVGDVTAAAGEFSDAGGEGPGKGGRNAWGGGLRGEAGRRHRGPWERSREGG